MRYISYLSADLLIDQSVWELKMNIIRTIKINNYV